MTEEILQTLSGRTEFRVKTRGGYYAGVAGDILVLHKVTRSKQCSINVIEQKLCFRYNPALSGTLFGEIETFVTKHG